MAPRGASALPVGEEQAGGLETGRQAARAGGGRSRAASPEPPGAWDRVLQRTQQRCLWLRAPPHFRSVCSPIVPEADGAAVRERSRPARRTTARGGVHARRGTDVRPHGRPRFTRWVAGFVVTYEKDRDAGPGRRRVSPRSKAPGPTAPCPVGP